MPNVYEDEENAVRTVEESGVDPADAFAELERNTICVSKGEVLAHCPPLGASCGEGSPSVASCKYGELEGRSLVMGGVDWKVEKLKKEKCCGNKGVKVGVK